MSITVTLLSVLPLLLIAGFVFFQVRLSRCDSKWPGLIFPALLLCNSLRAVAQIVMHLAGAEVWEIVAASANALFGGNAVTLILLGIYIVQRKKKQRHAQLEKMKVQDLG